MSGYWPHFSAVSKRASNANQEAESGDLNEVAEKYTTKGRVERE